MKEFFVSETFQFLEVKFSVYLNRRVFVMWMKTVRSMAMMDRVLNES